MDAFSTGRQVRLAARTGRLQTHTSGLASAYQQANLVVLPQAMADDFLRYCQANPRPCPLLAVSQPGHFRIDALAEDLDIRTDLPRYRVWQSGRVVDEPTEVRGLWRDDLVSFALGCSFSFEHALLAAGIPLRHVAQGRNVAMYRTGLATTPAGRFHGHMVVSMRPLSPADAHRASQITTALAAAHGAPIHIGDPAQIGIADLSQPDFGDPVDLLPGEVPVFWACGVTPQLAIEAARPDFCITHAPGHMLVTDRLNSQLTPA